MAERYGGDYIDTVLKNDATITALVSDKIEEGPLFTKDNTSKNTINFYKTGPVNKALEYDSFQWSVDCRGESYTKSRDIATAAADALNRAGSTVNSKLYFSVVEILRTLPPVNDTDVYNTPVQVTIRRR